MLALAKNVEKPLAREIARAMTEMGKDPNTATDILATHKARTREILTKQYRTTFEVFGERILKAAAKAEELHGTEQFTQSATQWIKQVGAAKVTEIAGTTFEQAQTIIQSAVATGLEEGLGEIATAKLVQEEMRTSAATLSRFRSRVIARTETHSASNAANQQAAVATGIPNIMKEWVASGDERTREDHRIAHGQIRPLDQPFEVGGEFLMFPSDPHGSADQVINCRCAAVQIVS